MDDFPLQLEIVAIIIAIVGSIWAGVWQIIRKVKDAGVAFDKRIAEEVAETLEPFVEKINEMERQQKDACDHLHKVSEQMNHIEDRQSFIIGQMDPIVGQNNSLWNKIRKVL